MTDPLRIALITDTHFWPGCARRFGGEGSQLQPWSETLQATLLTQIHQASPHLLIHLGDMTCGGGTFGMDGDRVRQTLVDTFAQFGGLHIPFHALPGNHDAPLGERWSFFEELAGLSPGLGRTLETDQAVLVLLHSQGHDGSQIADALPGDPTSGWVSPEELARLERSLQVAGDRPVLLFCHQLLYPFQGDQIWHSLFEIANRQPVLDLLARSGQVRAVFQGHAHRLNVHQVDLDGAPCTFVVAPAIIEYPMAWMLLELSRDALRVQMQPLPLPELVEMSRTAGEGGEWRAGRPEWQTFSISLAPNPAKGEAR